ncbi:hypothetical protein [Endozoicomonas sp.]|uniref:hypothetical protein n=1 Tax=Endozoicomonas sp. TaxID=1892382 RepID=UPI003D9BC2A0
MTWKTLCHSIILSGWLCTGATGQDVIVPEDSGQTLLALRDSTGSDINELRQTMTDFSPELIISKPAIRELLSNDSEREQSHVLLTGPDSQTRPIAVNFQRAFEQSIIKMLHKGKIKSATAIIHTDRPRLPYAI